MPPTDLRASPSPGRRAGRAALVALLLALLAALLATGPAAAQERRAKRPPQPNIIFIQTDDQARSTMRPDVMPNLYGLLRRRGTSFSDFIATTPLCCPSRATQLTGQYGHNNGVLRNDYSLLVRKRNVLPEWLRRAGYKTAHVGKFLNGYDQNPAGELAPAPGWDLWFTQIGRHWYYRWRASLNGRNRYFGTRARSNLIRVTNRFAVDWTKRLLKRSGPFYLKVDNYAPHGGRGRDETCRGAPSPIPRDVGRFAHVPLSQPPSFNEADISDKPNYSHLRLLDEEMIGQVTDRYHCTLEALHGVDRGIGAIHRAVERAGELNRTVFIFTSDNGYFYGEHRIPKGKPPLAPYEESLRVPLTIVAPKRYRAGARRLPVSGAPVANIDLAPTILRLARAAPCRAKRICRTLDGRSLLPLLRRRRDRFPARRAIGIEIRSCAYRGVRLDRQVYFQYSTPGEGGCAPDALERYDLRADPFQLENLAPAPPGSAAAAGERRLARLTAHLRDCAGVRGRDPEPISGHYCR